MDFDEAMQAVRLIPRPRRDDEIGALWARLDVLEELVNHLYDRLHIVYEGESEEEQ